MRRLGLLIKKILAFVYFGAGRFYSFLFRVGLLKTIKTPGVVVLGVGNLVVGGAGKTSFVVWLSCLLNSLDKKHFIISRGYKKLSKKEVVVSDGKKTLASVKDSGDEPFMVAELLNNTPVVVGNKTKALMLGLSRFNIKTCLVDDAYQTFRLNLDVNILLLDMSLEIKNYQMFPLGLLREPLCEIKRANIIVYTKINLNSKKNVSRLESLFEKYIDKERQLVLRSFYCSSLFFLNCSNKLERVAFSGDRLSFPVYVVVGIAQPLSFKKTASEYFSNIIYYNIVKDHFHYPVGFIKNLLVDFKQSGARALVTTRKDFVKIVPFLDGLKVYVVDVEHDVKNDHLIRAFLLNVL